MILIVHAVAGAKRNSVEWKDDTTAKVFVTTPPEQGKANVAIIALLAKDLHIAKSLITLVRGSRSRVKYFDIPKNAKGAD